MNSFKRILALGLALGLLHLSALPAAAALRSAPGRAGRAPTDLGGGTSAPSGALGRAPTRIAGTDLGAYNIIRTPFDIPSKIGIENPSSPFQAADLLGAAVIPQQPGARSLLEQMDGAIRSTAQQGPSRAAGAIQPFYTGERALSSLGDPAGVNGGAPQAHGSGLRPSDGRQASEAASPAVKPLGRKSSQAGSAKIIVVIVAAVAIVIGALVYFMWSSGKKQDQKWMSSAANQRIVAIEKASRDADAPALKRLGQEARASEAMWRELIAEAKSRRSGTVNDGRDTSLDDAKFYEAGEAMAGARAELNHNFASTDPQERIGRQLPETWKERLSRLEAQAVQEGFEGRLLIELKALKEELAHQDKVAAGLRQDLAKSEAIGGAFASHIGEMKERASGDLNRFRQGEMEEEAAFWAKMEQGTRERTAARLYDSDPEYRQHKDRHDRLSGIVNGALARAAEQAKSIEDDLTDLAEARKKQIESLLEAPKHKRLPYDEPLLDQNGNQVYENGKPVTRRTYRDQSRPYYEEARRQGEKAAELAGKVTSALKALGYAVIDLRRDPVLNAEGLAFALPSGGSVADIYPRGSQILIDLVRGELIFLDRGYTPEEIHEALGGFRVVRRQIEQVQGEAGNRARAESDWLSEALQLRLAQEEALETRRQWIPENQEK